MEDRALDLRPYFQMLHAMIREDGSDEEIDRTNRVMQWVMRTRMTIERVCEKDEMNLIGLVWEHWTKYGQCPSRLTSDILAHMKDKPKVLTDLLEEYDQHLPDLKKFTHADMDVVLELRIRDFEEVRLTRILDQAGNILVGGVPHPDSLTHKGKDLPPLRGTRDALNYLIGKFQKGILVNDVRAVGGLLSDYKDRVEENYKKNQKDKANNRLFISTGIEALNIGLGGGLKRKEMTGILGYTGQRKTAVLRTMAYYAALNGFRVLHIPLESDFDEELTAYNVMHAHTRLSTSLDKVTRRRFEGGEMTPDEYRDFMKEVIPDFAEKVGKNLIVYDPKTARTWADIKAVIERENYIQPLDLVVIDYLTLLQGDPAERDQVKAKTAIIQDAKQLCLSTGDAGFALVTPVQGNRKGYEDAVASDGVWEATGIHLYSEIEKTVDNCLYVFTTDEIAAQSRIKIGSCKLRRGANIPSTFIPMEMAGGIVGYDKNKEREKAEDNIVVVPPNPTEPTKKVGLVFPWMEPK